MWLPPLSGAITKYIKRVLENISQDWHTGSERIAGGCKHKDDLSNVYVIFFGEHPDIYVGIKGI